MAILRKHNSNRINELRHSKINSKGVMSPSELRKLASKNQIETSPIDLESVIKGLNIRLVKRRLEDEISGYLKKDNENNWVIGVNSSHHPNRQRFTLAHELAHYILHRKSGMEFEDTTLFRSNESNPMEWEANRFASELLMPETEFKDLLKRGINDIDEIADYFNVSTLAVRVRAKVLGFNGHGL